MMVRSSGCAAVDAMDRIRIVGNVIPQSWYREILRDNGKPYLLAVTLLSDIVYWYRPVEERDESSGYVIGLRKRFRGDLLQKTYEEYAALYGESKRTIKAALDRLEELGLIRKVFREIKLKNGTRIPNVMYIEIFPDRIEAISHYDIQPSASEPTGQKVEYDIQPSASGPTGQKVEYDIQPSASGPTGQKMEYDIHSSASGPTDQKMENEEPDAPARRAYIPPQSAGSAGSEGGGAKFCRTPHKILYDHLQNFVPYSAQDCTHVLQNSGGYPTADVGTNTENTSETTGEIITKNSTEISRGGYSPVQSCQSPAVDNSGNGAWDALMAYARPARVAAREQGQEDRRTDRDLYIGLLRDQVEYGRLLQEDPYGDRINIVDGILNIIADIATTDPPDGYERVNGRPYPHEVVKSRLLKMDYETINHVLDRFKENKTEIRNMRSYLLTALYNARDEKDIQFQNFFNHTYYGTDWTLQRK